MSSWHLEESGRGFSFRKDEPLDMRFDPEKELTAERIINYWSEKELEKIFREYGEERFSRRIAKRIFEQRKRGQIKTTFQLIEIIRESFPKKYKFGKTHFATRVFQALRIAVNDELENLKEALPRAIEVLKPEGRIIIISFHSLEDRIVKNFFRNEAKREKVKILTKKPIKASREETKKNKRARSAKLRAAEKI